MTRLSRSIEFRPGSRPGALRRSSPRRARRLAWERVWPALWPASGIAGCSSPPRCSDCSQLLPWPLHALILAGASRRWGSSLYFALRGCRAGRPGTKARGGSNATARSSIGRSPKARDALAAGAGDPYAEALWNAHLSRRLADIGELQLSLAALRSAAARSARAALCRAASDRGRASWLPNSDWSSRSPAAFGPGTARSRQHHARCLDRSAALHRRCAGLSHAGRRPRDRGADGLDDQSARAWRKPCALDLHGRRVASAADRGEYAGTARITESTHLCACAPAGAPSATGACSALPDDKPHDRVRVGAGAHRARRAEARLHGRRRLRRGRGARDHQAAWPLWKAAGRRSAAGRGFGEDAYADELSAI